MSDLPCGVKPPGYRLPAETRPGPVTLQVADLGRSLDWYRRVLGLHLLDQASGHATLGDEAGKALVELAERPGAAPVPRRGRLGLFHFALLLPSREDLGRFVAHLDRVGEPVGASDHLVSEALYLYDPDGLGVEVYADRPRDSWRQNGLELHMATEPLDLHDLVRAGGDGVWRGMPGGTVMGHVHLHVAELDRAERFYHAALGLDKVVWSYPGALFLSAGGYHHHLGLNTWARAAPPAGPDDARLLRWTLVVPDVDELTRIYESLDAAGEPVTIEEATLATADPWGTRLEVRARD